MDDNANSTTVIDSRGTSNGVSARNTSLMHTAGVVRGAFELSDNDYITLANTPIYTAISSGKLTISLRYKWAGVEDRILWYSYGSAFNGIQGMFDEEIGIRLDAATEEEIDEVGGTYEYDFEQWHHYVWVLDQINETTFTIKMYIDASLKFDATYTGSLLNLSSAISYIGFDGIQGGKAGGCIDDFMIFNKSLSAAEVSELFITGRDGGCYRVYRGQDGIIDYNNVQAVMQLSDTNVVMTNQVLPPNTIWHFVRRRVSDCGLESPDSPIHKVVINSEGTMILNTPNVVQDLIIEPLAGGVMQLRWRYFNTGQEVAPTGFKIFIDSGSGFDWNDPVATVRYKRAVEHKWKSAALTHGITYKFCIRSYTTNAGETINTNYVAAKADAQGPLAAEGISASWETV